MSMLNDDKIRARTIVVLASSMTQTPILKSWLYKDEKGSFESMAIDLLKRINDPNRVKDEKELAASQDEINIALAQAICLEAMDTLIRINNT